MQAHQVRLEAAYQDILVSLLLTGNSCHWPTAPSGPEPPHYPGFTITLRHITIDRTSLDEPSARRRKFSVTKYNTHKRQTSMPPAGFGPTIPTSERPQIHTLDRAATGTGTVDGDVHTNSSRGPKRR
jgi:hypothetical protein